MQTARLFMLDCDCDIDNSSADAKATALPPLKDAVLAKYQNTNILSTPHLQ